MSYQYPEQKQQQQPVSANMSQVSGDSYVNNNNNNNPYQPNQYQQQQYQQQQPQQIVIQNIEDGVSVGMVLFITGFCCVITWWIGCCYPRVKTARDKTWRTLNIVFTVISLLFIIGYVIAIVVLTTQATKTIQQSSSSNGRSASRS
ncbi:hypothetical protein MIR68_005024 [Amoeboaphelidium protococcarum]|nr:hypothetical protein MIR68_005024 [Amoeboaphelidium protococcarum]